MTRRSTLISLVAAMVLPISLIATDALSAVVASTGGALLRVDNRSDITPSSTASVAFVTLPGAAINFSLSTGRLIKARFTAASKCVKFGSGSSCAVRIVAINTGTSAIVELHPQAGFGFAFDSDVTATTDDFGEAHAMDRSLRLAAGNYSIRVQFAVTDTSTAFTLDDWHFSVETFQ